MQPHSGAVPQAAVAPPWAGGAAATGAGVPGMAQPGYGHPGIGQPGQGSLHAYRPAQRQPARAEVPSQVINALRAMWVGLGATVLNLILAIVAVVQLDNLATPTPVTDAQNAASTHLGVVALFALFPDFFGIALWPVMAIFVRRARKWAAIVGTVLFGLQTACTIGVILGTPGEPGVKITSFIIWGLGLAATIMLWSAPARAFYQQFK
jgi:hypothetical protein